MNRGGFSWKRAVGITNVKRKIGKATGIPLTKGGRQQKVARLATGGCLTVIINAFIITSAIMTGIIVIL